MKVSFCDLDGCAEKAPWFDGSGAGFGASDDGIRVTIGSAGSTRIELCPLHAFAYAVRVMGQANRDALLGALTLEGFLPNEAEPEPSATGERELLRELGYVIGLLDRIELARFLLPSERAIREGACQVFIAHGGRLGS